jgi:hypothetical protein
MKRGRTHKARLMNRSRTAAILPLVILCVTFDKEGQVFFKKKSQTVGLQRTNPRQKRCILRLRFHISRHSGDGVTRWIGYLPHLLPASSHALQTSSRLRSQGDR